MFWIVLPTDTGHYCICWPQNNKTVHLKHSFCYPLHPVYQGDQTTHPPQTNPLWLPHQTAQQDDNIRIYHITWIIPSVKLFISQCKTSAKFMLQQLTTDGGKGYCAIDTMYSHSSLLSSIEFLNPIQPCHIVFHNFCFEWNSAIFPDYKPANTARHTFNWNLQSHRNISWSMEDRRSWFQMLVQKSCSK